MLRFDPIGFPRPHRLSAIGFPTIGFSTEERRRAYRKGVEDQLRQGAMPSPWEELRERLFLGGEVFVARLLKGAAGALSRGERKLPRWARKATGFADVVAAVESARGERWDEFRDRYGDSGRDMAIFLARRATGLRLRELARELGAASLTSVSMAGLRYEKRLKTDRKEMEIAKRAAALLKITI